MADELDPIWFGLAVLGILIAAALMWGIAKRSKRAKVAPGIGRRCDRCQSLVLRGDLHCPACGNRMPRE
jgi:hypothetical protein